MSQTPVDPLINQYFSEIEGFQGLPSDVEIELAERIQEGDEEALHRLVEANLRFVVSVAKKYQHRNLALPELISAGNMGLITAARRFDGKRGFKFISYAVWWIRQSILATLAEHPRLIHVPLNQQLQLNRINKVAHKLEHELGRSPKLEEVAREAEMELEDVDTLLTLQQQQPLSLDEPYFDDAQGSLVDRIADDSALANDETIHAADLKVVIRRALRTLSDQEAQVLIMYYGLEGEGRMTLEEIGAYFGRTRERVRQIKEKALQKLRSAAKNKVLREYY